MNVGPYILNFILKLLINFCDNIQCPNGWIWISLLYLSSEAARFILATGATTGCAPVYTTNERQQESTSHIGNYAHSYTNETYKKNIYVYTYIYIHTYSVNTTNKPKLPPIFFSILCFYHFLLGFLVCFFFAYQVSSRIDAWHIFKSS